MVMTRLLFGIFPLAEKERDLEVNQKSLVGDGGGIELLRHALHIKFLPARTQRIKDISIQNLEKLYFSTPPPQPR
jgi:hypothetical protein